MLKSLELIWLDLAAYFAAIHAKGAALQQCWGFIDGTVRPIAWPTRNQRIMYSGHKRIHCLKFQVWIITRCLFCVYFMLASPLLIIQSVETPNGLIAHILGPVEGRRHDAFMLGMSDLLRKLRKFNLPNGEPYVIYGDPAYRLSRNILNTFCGAHITAAEQKFNKSMIRVRISVEWGFGKILQYFSFLDFRKNQKVLLQPIGKYFLVLSIMINCHTCLYGSLTSNYFGVDPPSLENYLSNSQSHA